MQSKNLEIPSQDKFNPLMYWFPPRKSNNVESYGTSPLQYILRWKPSYLSNPGKCHLLKSSNRTQNFHSLHMLLFQKNITKTFNLCSGYIYIHMQPTLGIFFLNFKESIYIPARVHMLKYLHVYIIPTLIHIKFCMQSWL